MKQKGLILVASVLVIWVVASENKSGASAQRKTAEEESTGGWEYLVVQGGHVNLSPSDNPSMRKEPGAFNRESFALEKNLDKLGSKGWEMVSVGGPAQDPIFYFKRKK